MQVENVNDDHTRLDLVDSDENVVKLGAIPANVRHHAFKQGDRVDYFSTHNNKWVQMIVERVNGDLTRCERRPHSRSENIRWKTKSEKGQPE